VGFDDMMEAQSFWPPLTTVRQDFTAVGRLSIQKLLRKIAGSGAEGSERTLVPTRLIVRESTGPAPAVLF
jgi:DNA-binding LacI/PurR family transcriptional regulator